MKRWENDFVEGIDFQKEKGKQLTNMRSSGADDAINLTPPKIITIETGLEVMDKDEYLEITPESVRLRKKYLTEIERTKAGRKK